MLRLWYVQAVVIGVVTSGILNFAPRLPYIKDVKATKMRARLVGYGGQGIAYMLWCLLNPQQSALNALAVCSIIVGFTLGINILVNWHQQDNPKDGGQVIQIRLTEKGSALLEELIEQRAPTSDKMLRGLFKTEQRRETAQEHWEDAMFHSNVLPGLLDEIMACIVQALKEGQATWLLTALAEAQEAKQEIYRTRHNVRLWYRLYWPQHAR
jgi:hypothetical protein